MVALLLLSTFLGPFIQNANAQVAGKFSLQVNTMALNCAILNMWVTVQSSSGAVVQSGFAPLTFLGNAGGTYTVSVGDFQDKIFQQWENHSTSKSRTITLSADTVVVAYYETGAAVQHRLTVNAASMVNGAALGMWTTIQPSGGSAQTGFTPISAFTSSSGTSFTVSVSDYQNLVFDHWENGSTARTRTISISADTTITAYFRTVTAFTLTINSASTSGGSIVGMFTTIASGSSTVSTGFTPVRYSANVGGTYAITPQDYGTYIFDHWENGSTARTRTVTVSGDVSITAYYRTTSSVSLMVDSAVSNGGSLSGMFVTIFRGTTAVATGFTPLTYTATAGASYTIVPQDYGSYTFNHWENGSTARTRTVTPTSSLTLTAYYSKPVISINVNTVTLSGASLPNVYTTILQGNTYVAIGNTPMSFSSASPGTTYLVTPTDHEVFNNGRFEFDHWSDGSTVRGKTITPSSSITLTAYYKSRNGSSQTVSVQSAGLSGNPISGLFTLISPSNFVITSDHTPRSYTLYQDTTYTITPLDYGSYFFDHWENGSTSRGRNITPTAPMTVTAYYRTALPTGGDMTPPSVTILAPTSGAVMSNSSPTIFGSASDNVGVTKVEVSVDGRAFSAATGLTEWSFGTTGLSNGSHSATVRISDISGNTKTSTVSFSVNTHPVLNKTGVYVPLFVYPAGKEMIHFYDVICAKQAHPSVPIVTAINPSSGPGNSIDANYVNAAKILKQAGVIVVGYVPTHYGSRDANAVLSDISKYINWYKVDGIFLDEFASYSTGYENYYRQITAQAKAQGMKLVMGNAGTDVPESYVGTVDTIGITEEDGYNPIEWLQYCIGCNANNGWHYKHDKTNYWFVRYAIGSLDPTYVSEAAKWTGLMYMTNGVSPTRWDGIPPYFQSLVAKLDTL